MKCSECDGNLTIRKSIEYTYYAYSSHVRKRECYNKHTMRKDILEGIEYKSLKKGDSLSLGDSRLEITGIGASNAKPGVGECDNEIHKNYIFCRVLVPGIITVGDQVNID